MSRAHRALRFGALIALFALLAACSGGRRAPSPGPPPPSAPPRAVEEPRQEGAPRGPGVWHVVQRGQTLWRICRTYGVALERVVEANGLRDPAAIEVGQRVFIPGARETMEVPLPPPVSTPAKGGWLWPVDGPITSRFGENRGSHRHKGLDIDTEKGQAIRAARAGRVVFTGRRGAYGLLVVLEHEGGFSSWYAHNSRVLVKSGQRVKAGERIAKSGRSGRASGTHLHFEIRHRGKPLDPLTFLP